MESRGRHREWRVKSKERKGNTPQEFVSLTLYPWFLRFSTAKYRGKLGRRIKLEEEMRRAATGSAVDAEDAGRAL